MTPPNSPTRAHDPEVAATADVPPAYATPPASRSNAAGTPLEVPGYEILDELGRGAMGVVFKARQVALNRTVALKMILAAEHATPRDLIRFLAEAEAVAAITHPNVVQVYEVGDHDGRPYMALEYCDGGTLATWLKACGKLPPRDAAALLEPVARGVAAAHDRGIVHRDLKPGNVLLKSSSPQPGSRADDLRLDNLTTLKVADFGLAKRARGDDLTHTNAVMGTPAYMAPEQAKGDSKFAGPAVDVWALGVMFYELLTGRRPFQADDNWSLMRQVLGAEPPRPCQLVAGLPADVEAICLRCLEKEPHDRYASATALADDLRRFANGEPVSVSSAGAAERALKWVKRNPTRASAYALAAAVIGLATFGMTLAVLLGQTRTARNQLAGEKRETEKARDQLGIEKGETEKALDAARTAQAQASAARDQAEDARAALARAQERLARVEYGRTMQVAHQEWRDHNVHVSRAMLNGTRPDLRGWEWHYVHRLCHADLQSVAVPASPPATKYFSPDGSRAVTIRADGSATVRDAKTGVELFPLRHAGAVLSAAFSGDGARIVTGSADKTAGIWSAATGAELFTLRGHSREVTAAAFSPDGLLIVTASRDATAKVWDAKTGGERLTLKGHADVVSAAVFSPDAARVVTGSWDKTARVWDAQTGNEVLALIGHTRYVRTAEFSADGSQIRTTGEDNLAKTWSAASGAEVRSLKGHANFVKSAAFNGDGSRVVTGSWDTTAKVWNPATGGELLTLRGHTREVSAASFRADGGRIVTGSWDGTAKVWEARAGAPLLTLRGHTAAVFAAEYCADGGRIVTGSADGMAKVWDGNTGVELLTLSGHAAQVNSAAFSADGTRVLTGSGDATAKIWDASSGRQILTLVDHTEPVQTAAFSADGARVVTGSRDLTAKVWDARTGTQLLTLKGHADRVNDVAIHPDGTRVATGSGDGTVRIWEATQGVEVLTLKGHTLFVLSVSFASDGSQLVTGSADATARIWDSRPLSREFLPKELAPLPRAR